MTNFDERSEGMAALNAGHIGYIRGALGTIPS